MALGSEALSNLLDITASLFPCLSKQAGKTICNMSIRKRGIDRSSKDWTAGANLAETTASAEHELQVHSTGLAHSLSNDSLSSEDSYRCQRLRSDVGSRCELDLRPDE